MMFRYTGLSPSLVRRSRRVLLHSTQNPLWTYRSTSILTYNTCLATTVIFKSPPCGFENTKQVWANEFQVIKLKVFK